MNSLWAAFHFHRLAIERCFDLWQSRDGNTWEANLKKLRHPCTAILKTLIRRGSPFFPVSLINGQPQPTGTWGEIRSLPSSCSIPFVLYTAFDFSLLVQFTNKERAVWVKLVGCPSFCRSFSVQKKPQCKCECETE